MSYEIAEAAPVAGGKRQGESRVAMPETLWSRLAAIVEQDAFVNLLVIAALGIGFFHGWLKLRFRSPITTFAFDLVVIVALVVVYLRSGSLGRFFPQGPTTKALFAFYGLCLAYLPFSLIPGMPPFLVALSTLRGWVFASLLYGLGYQIIRGRSQLHGYFLVILILSVITAIYGIRQSDSEVLQMMQEDPFFARRYRGQGYVDAEGDFHVRRFSTFISSGGFGATMATAIILGCSLVLSPTARVLEKTVIALMIVPIGYGMVLSGSRSAAITALVGCLGVLVARRRLGPSLVILAVIVIGGALASQATGGGVLDRLATLNFRNLFYRFWYPTALGFEFMLGHPLGGGLGKTGFSPSFLIRLSDYSDYLAPDGDLGRLMVEFGVLGILLFGWLAWNAAKMMFQTVKDTKALPCGPLVLAAATNLWISIAFVGVGSPFVGIPMGVLVWFFVGAAQRLREIETAPVLPDWSSMASLHGRAVPGVGRDSVPPRPGPSLKPSRRFLFLDSQTVATPTPDPVSRDPIPPSPAPTPTPTRPPKASENASVGPRPATKPGKGAKVFLYGP
ncbi:MAG: O-antigen ligase family protein [Limisphaerales bacterium]